MITYNRSGTAFPSVYNILNQPHTTFQPYVSKKKVKKQNYKPPNFYERPSDSFSNVPKKIKIVPYKGRDKTGKRFADESDDDDTSTPTTPPAAGVLPQGNNPSLIPAAPPLPKKLIKKPKLANTLPQTPPTPSTPTTPMSKMKSNTPKKPPMTSQAAYYVRSIKRNSTEFKVIDNTGKVRKFRPAFYYDLKGDLQYVDNETKKRFGLDVKGAKQDEIRRVVRIALQGFGFANATF
jgi:hypothetical protein